MQALQNHGSVFCPKSEVPLASCLRGQACKGSNLTCKILETEIHVESVAFVIGMRRFRYVLAI